MKPAMLILIIGALMAGSIHAALAPKESDEFNGLQAPAFKLKTVNGDEIDSAKLSGKPVVLCFLATWCIACQNEAKELNKLKDSGAAIVGVAVDSIADPATSKPEETPADAKKFATDEKAKFSVTIGDKKLCEDYHFKGIPMTVVIGPDGKIAKVLYGLQPGEKIAKLIESAAKK
jgi:peroxiredoxin